MTTWEKAALSVLTAVVSASGLAYLWMKYFMVTDDPLAVVNHPLQPQMLSVHVLAAPALVLVFGIVYRSHVGKMLGAGQSANRRSGLLVATTFLLMMASGYGLPVSTSDALSRVLVVVHVASGVLFFLAYLVHLVVSFRVRRLLAPAAVTVLPIVTWAAVSVGRPDGRPLEEVTRDVFLMGTRSTLATWAADRSSGLARLERFLRALEETEAELSTWRQDTRLSVVNRTRPTQAAGLSPPLCAVFREIDRWYRETDGAFDPSVGPLVAAWGIRGAARLPGTRDLSQARAATGWDRWAFDSAECRLTRPDGGWIDSGAFGKGEALDRARRTIADDGTPWLIDLGGQVMAHGAPPDADGWPIALAHPLRRDEAFASVTLRSGSLSTSGGSERTRVVRGTRVGHILDPRTGRPAAFDGAVTVWDDRGLTADILSTALYVMGPEAGLQWAETRQIAACFFVPVAGARVDVRPTRAWRTKFGDEQP